MTADGVELCAFSGDLINGSRRNARRGSSPAA